MRILLVSDLHYSMPQLDWVVRVAPDYDLVVVAGDTLSIRSSVPLEAQSVIVMQYLKTLQSASRLAVSSGNHDLTGPDGRGEQSALWLSEAREAGIPTDGDSMELDDLLVTICPWWDGPAGRADVEALLQQDAGRRPSRWVWVYHWPPTGSPISWTGRRHYGDADLRDWIGAYGPDIVLTGHVHESPFKAEGSWADHINETWVFNAGNQIGAIPAHIDLELDGGVVTWSSMLGVETLHLDDEAAPERRVV